MGQLKQREHPTRLLVRVEEPHRPEAEQSIELPQVGRPVIPPQLHPPKRRVQPRISPPCRIISAPIKTKGKLSAIKYLVPWIKPPPPIKALLREPSIKRRVTSTAGPLMLT